MGVGGRGWAGGRVWTKEEAAKDHDDLPHKDEYKVAETDPEPRREPRYDVHNHSDDHYYHHHHQHRHQHLYYYHHHHADDDDDDSHYHAYHHRHYHDSDTDRPEEEVTFADPEGPTPTPDDVAVLDSDEESRVSHIDSRRAVA